MLTIFSLFTVKIQNGWKLQANWLKFTRKTMKL